MVQMLLPRCVVLALISSAKSQAFGKRVADRETGMQEGRNSTNYNIGVPIQCRGGDWRWYRDLGGCRKELKTALPVHVIRSEPNMYFDEAWRVFLYVCVWIVLLFCDQGLVMSFQRQ